MIHGYWLREHKIDGDYVREDVAPAAIGRFLDRLGETYVGANVTIPHKEAAFAKLKRPDVIARALGAANTLWFENGELSGTNTDVYGFLAHLDASLPGWDRRTETALVLGAGGASRSIVYALLERGAARIVIANRTRARAEALAARFGSKVAVADWASISKALAASDLLVNATSLGMKGQPPLELDLTPLKQTAAVYDIVYVPLQTPLLAAARARGNPVIDGLGMLLHQAAPGFERWFGVRPKVTPALRALVLADLGEEGAAMIVLGLTGSLGMGKSTTAKLFAEEGIPVFDADAAVHRLYDGEAAPLIEEAFPGTTSDGRVDRARLSARVLGMTEALKKLEAIVHPLVRAAREKFLAEAEEKSAPVVLLDVPLLFETGGHGQVDKVVVVSAPPEIQRERVLERPEMTEEKFEAIMERQMPDSEKRSHADFVIDTSQGIEAAREQVRAILKGLASGAAPRPKS